MSPKTWFYFYFCTFWSLFIIKFVIISCVCVTAAGPASDLAEAESQRRSGAAGLQLPRPVRPRVRCGLSAGHEVLIIRYFEAPFKPPTDTLLFIKYSKERFKTVQQHQHIHPPTRKAISSPLFFCGSYLSSYIHILSTET